MSVIDMEPDPRAPPIAAGDWCTWLHTPRGGYGYVIPVDARVVRVTPARAQVEVTLRSGARELRWVRLAHLRRWARQPQGAQAGAAAR
jgi:hypothetical protein